ARPDAGDGEERMEVRARLAAPRAGAGAGGRTSATRRAGDSIFLALADLDPRERDAFVTERCRGNEQLRRDVESLLATLDEPDKDSLDPRQIPSLDMAAVDGPLQPGTGLGSFLVLHAL